MQEYAVVGFDHGGWFCKAEYNFQYAGFGYKILREVFTRSGKFSPVSNQVVIETQTEKLKEVHESVLVFLSELAWQYDVPVYSVSHGGGSSPLLVNGPFAGAKAGRIAVDLDLFEPMYPEGDAKLALSLYRDGLGCNNIFYGFLSLYRILEIRLRGRQISEYIKRYYVETKPSVSGEWDSADGFERHLYVDCRCAVAHANSIPVADINSFDDKQRLANSFWLIKKLVEYYIANEFGLNKVRKSSTFVWINV